jgi:hypothetical protein
MNSPNNNEGYLYVVYNPIFAKDVYKLGRTNNLKTRLRSYVTGYIEPSKYLYTTKMFKDCVKAERILFFLLRKYRIREQREFFELNIDRIINTIKTLENLSDKNFNLIYSKINSKICPDNILELINDEDYFKLLDFDYTKYNDLLEKFRYNPNNKNKLLTKIKIVHTKLKNDSENDSEDEIEDNLSKELNELMLN